MNYIKSLQAENAELKNRVKKLDEEITQFIVFLNSPKFTGIEQNGTGAGDRKDWIATGDVIMRLREMRNIFLGL